MHTAVQYSVPEDVVTASTELEVIGIFLKINGMDWFRFLL